MRHTNDIQNWLFVGPTLCNLTTGLSTFAVTPPGALSTKALFCLSFDFKNNQDHTTMADGILPGLQLQGRGHLHHLDKACS